MDTETPATILVKLRTRMNELLRLGIVTPEGFGMYQQTVLQLLQEFDRRKASCFAQAEQLRTQAAAVESQGHAFGVSGSILFAVVNGYIDAEEKRVREDLERQKDRQAGAEPVAPPKKKVRAKKDKEPVEDASAPSPGAVPHAPDEG